ncbi:MAG: histidine phosphatase family protein, partial [Muribaculaceae bacterium]|nr:histidine phosphatase family protein [Muribaculaceae bacterium]
MKTIKTTLLLTALATALTATATIPATTHYTMDECAGSLMPYPVPSHNINLPDSLTPIFINHVGRHGARYPSSPKATQNLNKALSHADSIGTITPTGRKLHKLVQLILNVSHNRWGELDTLGMAEQRGIATRMYRNFPSLFNNSTVTAISSSVPRCVMSMYDFTHQLDR